jgi:hypothetical protein
VPASAKKRWCPYGLLMVRGKTSLRINDLSQLSQNAGQKAQKPELISSPKVGVFQANGKSPFFIRILPRSWLWSQPCHLWKSGNCQDKHSPEVLLQADHPVRRGLSWLNKELI